jgi:hypothetical protein
MACSRVNFTFTFNVARNLRQIVQLLARSVVLTELSWAVRLIIYIYLYVGIPLCYDTIIYIISVKAQLYLDNSLHVCFDLI